MHSRIAAAPSLILATAFMSISNSAFAASATWNGTTNGLWSTTTNWSATPVPGVGDTATFNNAGNGNTTITVGTISLTLGGTSSFEISEADLSLSTDLAAVSGALALGGTLNVTASGDTLV